MFLLLLLIFHLSLVDCRQTRASATTGLVVLPSGERPKPELQITEEPRAFTMTTLGSSVTLSCNGTATLGQPAVSWLFTNEITSDISEWEEIVGGTSGTLILGNLQKSEGGYYFCKLTDGYGYQLITKGAQVVVTYLDADFVTYPEGQEVTSAKSFIKIPCQAPPSNPAATINWYKDSVLIENKENMFQEYVSSEEYGSLIIFNPSTSDSGDYACEAGNVHANPEKRRTSAVTVDIQVDGVGTYAQKFVQDHYVLVKKGEDAVLKAGAIGNPAPDYRWTLGVSVEIDTTSASSRFSTSDFGRELRITNVKVEDRGTYWCQYSNVYTENVAVVRLYVIESIEFDTVMTEQTVEHLTPLTFDCQCSGTPFTSGDPTAPPSVLWLRDGQPIVDGDRFKEEDGSLVATGLEMSEAGMYQCFCYNTIEITQTYMPVTVKNMTVPVSIDGNDRAEGVYNENINIVCRANGYPLPIVTWFKDSSEITAEYDARYTISQQNSNDYVTSTLTVLSVKDSDAGQLICQAVNQKVDTYTAQLGITFIVGHEIAPSISLADISIQLNSQIVFEAVAFGYPTPTISWYKDNYVPIVTSGRYFVDEETLFIDGAQSSDTGLYIVKASNGVGEDAYANATITLGTNQTLILSSTVGGFAGLLFVICLGILLYVLMRQKKQKNSLPPPDAETPMEKEIERRIKMASAATRESPVIGFNPKPDLGEKTVQSLYLRDNPALCDVNTTSRNLPPILRAPLDVGEGVDASTITSDSSAEDSDSSVSHHSKTKIMKRMKNSKVAPK